MFVCIQRVGSNFGIIDTNDGVIEWVNKQKLIAYAKQVQIGGVTLINNGTDVQTQYMKTSLDPQLCNWADGNNIFRQHWVITKDQKDSRFTWRTIQFRVGTCKKAFKAAVSPVDANGMITLHFSFNVLVTIPATLYQSLVS